MKISENGIRIDLVQEGGWRPLVESTGKFLRQVIDLIQKEDPLYWLILEIGNHPLFSCQESGMLYEEYESSVVLRNDEMVLLRGNSFSRYYDLYQGDCPAVISLMEPPVTEAGALMRAYEHTLLKKFNSNSEAFDRYLVNKMTDDDLYFYCHEASYFAFYSWRQNIEAIKDLALTASLPVTERLAFEDR